MGIVMTYYKTDIPLCQTKKNLIFFRQVAIVRSIFYVKTPVMKIFIVPLFCLLMLGCSMIRPKFPIIAKGSHAIDMQVAPVRARNAALESAKIKALWQIKATLVEKGITNGIEEYELEDCLKQWCSTQRGKPFFGSDGTVVMQLKFYERDLRYLKRCIRNR
jgi:hypothetical protein